MKTPFYQTYTLEQSADNVHYLVDNPSELSLKKFSNACQGYFEKIYPGYKALLVSSCTRALDLIAIALDLGPGDEVVLPSFNYVGVANAFAATGAKLVFADIDAKTMNVSIEALKKCLTAKTKAVAIMNYAGMGKDLEEIKLLCDELGITLVEDNAQGIGAFYNNKRLGSFGDFSCISFDSLKNLSCGEGGVVLYKSKFEDAVQTVFHNGTNRLAFEKGEVDAYEWVSLGSKFALSEFNAAIMLPLLENSEGIILERLQKWNFLYDTLWEVESLRVYLPNHMRKLKHNAHIFYLKFVDNDQRDLVMGYLQENGISCSFHYTPLHSSKMGLAKNYSMPVDNNTTTESEVLLRLPIFNALTKSQIQEIKSALCEVVNKR